MNAEHFMVQQVFLDFKSAGKADETAVFTDDPVARNQKRQRVITTCGTDGTRQISGGYFIAAGKLQSDIFITASRPIRDRTYLVPHLLLEITAVQRFGMNGKRCPSF